MGLMGGLWPEPSSMATNDMKLLQNGHPNWQVQDFDLTVEETEIPFGYGIWTWKVLAVAAPVICYHIGEEYL